MTTKNMRAMVPVLINDLEITMKKAKVKPDAAAAIFHQLFLTGQRMKKNDSFAAGVPRETRWRPVSAKVLGRIAGRKYADVIRAMIQAEWIELRMNEKTGKPVMLPGKLTYMYRIHPQLTSQNETKEYLRVYWITNCIVKNGIIRQMKYSAKKRLELMNGLKSVHRKILEQSQSFLLNEDKLEQDINSGKLTDERIADFLGEAISFNQRDALWFSCDSFGKRLHYPLSNQDKKLRPYLYLEKKPKAQLALCDLKNCQPFLLSAVFVKPELITFNVPEFIGLIPELEKRSNHNDVKTFHIDCSNGRLYPQYMLATGRIDDLNIPLTEDLKDTAKKELFKNVFFSRPKNPYRVLPKEKKTEKNNPDEKTLEKTKANLNFIMTYKEVWNNIYYLKKRKKYEFPFILDVGNKKKKGDRMFTLLNCLAQRIESAFIFEIAERAFRQCIKVVTIHDAFVIEACHIDKMLAIINDFFKNELKVLPPTVAVELINSAPQ